MSAVMYEIFNRKFFGGKAGVKWFDRKGVKQLGNDLMATITLSTCGTSREYERYVVKIISKDFVVDSHSFKFSTYFSSKNETCYDGCKIVEHCCEDTGLARWYIEKPTKEEQSKMVKQIFDYINTYKKGLMDHQK